MLIIYRFITFILYYLTLPFTWLAYRHGSLKWKNRLGYFKEFEKRPDVNTIWLHASSVGEVKVAKILRNQLFKLDPTLIIIVTVMTEAGYQTGLQIIDNVDWVGYIPLDHSVPIRRFLKSIKPNAAVFIETEIWPNIICELSRYSAPIFLANGRLSERSAKRYRRIIKFLKEILSKYSYFMVQSEVDCSRFIDIGAPENKIEIIGSLKFDAPIEPMNEAEKTKLKNSLPFEKSAPVLIAGSTRAGEEEIMLRVFDQLKGIIENLVMIIAPRHLNRITDLKILLRESNYKTAVFSDITDSGQNCDIILVDKMGMLGDLYSISDIAFVGGTMTDIGGHNILEPVWSGIPVLFGPSIANVRDSAEYIIDNKFGAMVEDEKSLMTALANFFKNKSEFRRKTAESDEAPRANKTAQIILNRIISDGENLAKSN